MPNNLGIPPELLEFLQNNPFGLSQYPRGTNVIAPGIGIEAGSNQFMQFAIGAALQAALARSQLGEATGKQEALYQGIEEPLEEQLTRLREARGTFRGSALAGTTATAAAAANAARLAGSGGNASAFAIRGAASAAGDQIGSLLNADLNALGQENQLTSALTAAKFNKAGALGNIYGAPSQLSFNIAQLLGGLASPGSQVQTAEIGRRAGREQSIIQALGQFFGG